MHIKNGKIVWFLCLIACLLSTASFALTKAMPLAVDRAFEFKISFNGPEQIIAAWRVAPGYYLYAKRMHISFEPAVAHDIRIPQGDFKYDKGRGQVEVLSGLVSVPILLQDKSSQFQMNVEYQGCSKHGFCYPPMHKTVLLNTQTLSAKIINESNPLASPTLIKEPSSPSLHGLLTDQNGVHALLATQHLAVLMVIFLGLGILLAFTPCVLPMVPILASIIAGQKQRVNTRKAFLLSCTYVLGTAVTYALAGILAAMMGRSLQVWLQMPVVIVAISGIFVLLACSLFGLFELRMPRYLQQSIHVLSNHQRGGTLFGVFMMGLLSTLIISPCVTAPLVGVLMYIAETGSMVLGGVLLFVMAIGMGLPLILLGMSAGKWLPKSGAWMDVVKKSFGIMMLAMVVWLLSRIIPHLAVIILSGLLLVTVALFVAIYLPTLIGRHKLNRSLGAVVGCCGLLVIAGGINISSMGLQLPMQLQKVATAPLSESFIIVHDIADLDKQLIVARLAKKSVLLDFYADWCESCISMDTRVFNSPEVKALLNNYVLLRADLTENSSEDEALLKKYAVIAPPTVLFFNAEGKEINKERIVGEVDAKEFLQRLNTVNVAKQCDKDKKINC